MRLTLSNLYAFLKPKTLTFKLSFSLSQLCLGSFRFPLSLFFPQTSHLQAIPIRSFAQFKTLSQLLCSFFADFGIFSCNLYGFTLDLKFSIDLNSVFAFFFLIKKIYRLHQMVELELCFRKLGFLLLLLLL